MTQDSQPLKSRARVGPDGSLSKQWKRFHRTAETAQSQAFTLGMTFYHLDVSQVSDSQKWKHRTSFRVPPKVRTKNAIVY